jgi:lysophospholipase L1-like esterase
VLIAAVILLTVEMLMRGVITLREDFRASEENEYIVYSKDLGWERRPHFSGRLSGVFLPPEPGQHIRHFDEHGFYTRDTEQVANNAELKIVTVGDSTTFGWGVDPGSTYSELLESLLPNASVINLGLNGYTSYQGYKILQKHGPLIRPNIIVVAFNRNDRRYVLKEDSIDGDAVFSRGPHPQELRQATQNTARKFYLFRVVKAVISKLGVPTAAATSPQPAAVDDIRTLPVRVSPEHYRSNLTKIIQLAESWNASVIFLALNDNPAYTEHLRRGIELFEGSHYDKAVRELLIALNLQDPFTELARKYLATAYEKLGADEDARRVARLDTPHPAGKVVYSDIEYNSIMRSVAKEYGVKVVEAGRVLDEDPSVYLDSVHPDGRGHRRIAELLQEAVNVVRSVHPIHALAGGL